MAKKRGYITLAQRQELYLQAETLVKRIQAFKKTLRWVNSYKLSAIS